MLVILLSVISAVLASLYIPDFEYAARKRFTLNLNETFFSSLDNYQVDATPVTEEKYPWIAKVVHSRIHSGPYMCTASCLRKRIFVTAARCLPTLKIQQTRVVYQKLRFSVLAFVLPSNGTKQAYDDIGFIVVTDTKFDNWEVVKLYGGFNRTDEAYQWFYKMPKNGTVVGYATTKDVSKVKSSSVQYNLTELNVEIGMDLCEEILNVNKKLHGFKVPCYFSCSVKQFREHHKSCKKYHGVEGGAVLDFKTKKLLGVSTWGHTYIAYDLPAGLSATNSANFYEDYKCAINIANYMGKNRTHLQHLCR